jgi:spore maturation protein CgeB
VHIFVVHPGASYATADVYNGCVAGLRANGVTVSTGRLDSVLAWYQAAIGRGVEAGRFAPDLLERAAIQNQGGPGGFNLSAYASAPITRGILTMDPWPDWVLVVTGANYNTFDVRALRRVGIPVALLCTESPYWAAEEVAIGTAYDVVFTHERAAVDAYRAAGLSRVHYLPHAYDPQVHRLDGPAVDPCDVRFVGSLFGERKLLFAQAEWGELDARIGGLDPDAPHPEQPAQITPNADVAALYRGAKVNLNHHRTTMMHGSGRHIPDGAAESLGPRAYEIAACGGFQLMDDSRAEARDLFGEALATYKAGDPGDLVRQARYWLQHEEARRDMAQAQHAAILGHSWVHRVATLLNVLETEEEPGATDYQRWFTVGVRAEVA